MTTSWTGKIKARTSSDLEASSETDSSSSDDVIN